MTESLVHVDRTVAGVATVTLMRGEKRNALNVPLLEQLSQAVERLETESTCRVIILSGDGSIFCAGLDLVEAADANLSERSAQAVRRIIDQLRTSPIVSICAAHGGAYAGGAGLLAACDLVVAADDLKIGFPEVRRGLVAAIIFGALANKIRDGELRELLLVAEPITALRAQAIGLVQWIETPQQLLTKAQSVAASILKGGPNAVRLTKRLLNQRLLDSSTLKQLHEEVRESAEAHEGFAAFRERREPNWL